jgi:hypothetical protein
MKYKNGGELGRRCVPVLLCRPQIPCLRSSTENGQWSQAPLSEPQALGWCTNYPWHICYVAVSNFVYCGTRVPLPCSHAAATDLTVSNKRSGSEAVTPCSLLDSFQPFGEPCCLNLQGGRPCGQFFLWQLSLLLRRWEQEVAAKDNPSSYSVSSQKTVVLSSVQFTSFRYDAFNDMDYSPVGSPKRRAPFRLSARTFVCIYISPNLMLVLLIVVN